MLLGLIQTWGFIMLPEYGKIIFGINSCSVSYHGLKQILLDKKEKCKNTSSRIHLLTGICLILNALFTNSLTSQTDKETCDFTYYLNILWKFVSLIFTIILKTIQTILRFKKEVAEDQTMIQGFTIILIDQEKYLWMMNTSYRVMIQANIPDDAVWSRVLARHQQILLRLFQRRKHVSPPG